jgi:hypothetical protein
LFEIAQHPEHEGVRGAVIAEIYCSNHPVGLSRPDGPHAIQFSKNRRSLSMPVSSTADKKAPGTDSTARGAYEIVPGEESTSHVESGQGPSTR